MTRALILALALAGCAATGDWEQYPGWDGFKLRVTEPVRYVDELPPECDARMSGCAVIVSSELMSTFICTPYVKSSVPAELRAEVIHAEVEEHCNKGLLHPRGGHPTRSYCNRASPTEVYC